MDAVEKLRAGCVEAAGDALSGKLVPGRVSTSTRSVPASRKRSEFVAIL